VQTGGGKIYSIKKYPAYQRGFSSTTHSCLLNKFPVNFGASPGKAYEVNGRNFPNQPLIHQKRPAQ